MRITCTKENINHAVQTVQKAVAVKSPLPILTGIYMTAHDNKLELQATDHELGIICAVNADVHEPGTIVISGKYFQEMVRRLPGDTVEITTSGQEHTVQITSNTAQFNLLMLPAEEFPVIKPLAMDNKLVIKDNILKEMIKKTVFACANDEARPIFTGGLLEASSEDIRLVATNTHRLALKKTALENFDGSTRMIIPAKILSEIARVLVSDVPIDVTITWQKNAVAFAFDDVYITSRLIEGQFPDYNKVIPPSFATNVILRTDAFLDAVDRVSLLAKDGEYNVIKFSFTPDCVTITSNNPDVGKASEQVAAVLEGQTIDIAFNAKYVSDILKNISSEEVVFNLNAPLSPASIKPINDDNYIYIITPVRTN